MQITTNTHAATLSDLVVDRWHIVAVQNHDCSVGEGWVYTIHENEIDKLHNGIWEDRIIESCQRRDPGRFVVLAKLKQPAGRR